MELHGSETEKNLMTALQGEALAHLKYQFYRSKISNYSKEYEQILDEIVHNEKEHGKIWFKLLHEGNVPNDWENLTDAITGEKYEATEMYPEFARIAKEEGFDEISELFSEVAKIERKHMYEFLNIRDEMSEGSTFKDMEYVTWECLNCGYSYHGKIALEECPICKHPIKYFSRS